MGPKGPMSFIDKSLRLKRILNTRTFCEEYTNLNFFFVLGHHGDTVFAFKVGVGQNGPQQSVPIRVMQYV